jgi:hypothetical protein
MNFMKQWYPLRAEIQYIISYDAQQFNAYSVLLERGVLFMRHDTHVSKYQVYKDFVFNQNDRT